MSGENDDETEELIDQTLLSKCDSIFPTNYPHLKHTLHGRSKSLCAEVSSSVRFRVQFRHFRTEFVPSLFHQKLS